MAKPGLFSIIAAHAVILLGWAWNSGYLLRPDLNLAFACSGYIEVPNRVYAAEQIRHGSLPEWTPLVLNGWPLFAESVTGVLYPGFLMYVLFPDPKTNDFFHAFHVLASAYFLFYLLRRLHVRPDIAALSSIIWMQICHFWGVAGSPPVLSSLTWAPLVLLLLDESNGRPPRLKWCIAVNTILLLAGHPQGAFLTFISEIVWMTLTWKKRPLNELVTIHLLLFGLPILLAFVQLLPLYDYYSSSHRIGKIVGGRAILPFNVFAIGTIAVLLLVAAIMKWRQNRSPILAIGALAFVSLAFSADGPSQSILRSLPVVGNFQIPAFYSYLAILAILILLTIILNDFVAAFANALGKSNTGSISLTSGILISAGAMAYAFAVPPDVLCSKHFYQNITKSLPKEITDLHYTRIRSFSNFMESTGLNAIGSQQYIAHRMMHERYATLCPPNCNLLPGIASGGIFNQDETLLPTNIHEFDAILLESMNMNLFRAEGITHLVSSTPIVFHLSGVNYHLSTDHQVASMTATYASQNFDELHLNAACGADSRLDAARLEIRSLEISKDTDYVVRLFARSKSPVTVAIELIASPLNRQVIDRQAAVNLGPDWQELIIPLRSSVESDSAALQLLLGNTSTDIHLKTFALEQSGTRVKSRVDSIDGSLKLIQDRPIWIYRIEPPGRRAWLTTELLQIRDPKARLDYIKSRRFSPLQHTIVERDHADVATAGNIDQDSVNVEQITAKKWIAEVDAKENCLCVFSDRYDEHLSARIDGRPTELLRVNHAFCGVSCPKGSHTIEITYRNGYLFPAALISISAFLFFLRLTIPRQSQVNTGLSA